MFPPGPCDGVHDDDPAVSVLANVSGQAILFRDGGWDAIPALSMEAHAHAQDIALLSGGQMIGLAPRSAMASIAASCEFFLGTVRDGPIEQTDGVSLVVRHQRQRPGRR